MGQDGCELFGAGVDLFVQDGGYGGRVHFVINLFQRTFRLAVGFWVDKERYFTSELLFWHGCCWQAQIVSQLVHPSVISPLVLLGYLPCDIYQLLRAI